MDVRPQETFCQECPGACAGNVDVLICAVGMHQLTSDLLKQAAKSSADPAQFPESAEEYGAYQVPKTYLHLYGENPIIMNWDIPMESFGGKTAYEVTRDLGFPAHASQQADFAWYFRGADRAAEVERYSPCSFGLYYSTVGEDTGEGDFFENLEPFLHPAEPEPTQPAPLPIQQPDPSPALRAAAPVSAADTNWLAVPAVGTAILAAMTAFFSAARHEEKN